MNRIVVMAALAFLVAVPARSTHGAAPDRLAADTPMATSAGATFTAPAGWSVTRRGNVVVLEPPEGDSHLAMVDVVAPTGEAAAAAAWAAYRPDAKWPVKLSTPVAPKNGWEEILVVNYETSPNERVAVFAVARRAGGTWTVAIVEATNPTWEKRDSPFSLGWSSLRPKGYVRETFAGRRAHKLDAARVAELRRFLEDGMRQLDVPGLSFSLVQDGKVVHCSWSAAGARLLVCR